MKQIFFATESQYKLGFANNLTKKHDWECLPCNVKMIEPQSWTLEEIATYKVKQAFEQIQRPIVTMDTGIFITALNGFPGVYTHDIVKMLDKNLFQKLMIGQTDRTANIIQVVSYYDGSVLKTFTSSSAGIIVLEEEMKDFWSYDAFFMPNNYNKLMGEMTEDEKGDMWGNDWNELCEFLNSL